MILQRIARTKSPFKITICMLIFDITEAYIVCVVVVLCSSDIDLFGDKRKVHTFSFLSVGHSESRRMTDKIEISPERPIHFECN